MGINVLARFLKILSGKESDPSAITSSGHSVLVEVLTQLKWCVKV